MRKLPIYIVFDSTLCGTGQGNAIAKAMEQQLARLRNDPYAIESAYCSIIANCSRPKILSELTYVQFIDWSDCFSKLDFRIDNSKGIEDTIDFTKKVIEHDVTPSSSNIKGDFPPLVYLAFNDSFFTTNEKIIVVKNWTERMFDFVEASASSFQENTSSSRNEYLYYWKYK